MSADFGSGFKRARKKMSRFLKVEDENWVISRLVGRFGRFGRLRLLKKPRNPGVIFLFSFFLLFFLSLSLAGRVPGESRCFLFFRLLGNEDGVTMMPTVTPTLPQENRVCRKPEAGSRKPVTGSTGRNVVGKMRSD